MPFITNVPQLFPLHPHSVKIFSAPGLVEVEPEKPGPEEGHAEEKQEGGDGHPGKEHGFAAKARGREDAHEAAGAAPHGARRKGEKRPEGGREQAAPGRAAFRHVLPGGVRHGSRPVEIVKQMSRQ